MLTLGAAVSSYIAVALFIAAVVFILLAGVVTALKGKWSIFFLGILFNVLGLVGAGLDGASGTTTPGLVQNVITLGLAIGATVMMWRSENALYYQANS